MRAWRVLLGWAALLVAALVLPAAAAPAPAGAASPTVLRFGVLAGFPPFQVWPAASRAGGADVELLHALAREAGLALELVRYTDFTLLEADLAAGRIDVATSMARTPARESRFLFVGPYVQVPLALVTRADQPSAALLPDLAGRSIAVVRGYASGDQADHLFPVATRVVVGSLLEGLEAVKSGRADTLLESLPALADLIERQQIKGLSIVRRVEAPSGRLHLALHPSRTAAAQALERALQGLPAGRADSLVQAWSVRYAERPPETLDLSDAERAQVAAWRAPVVGVVGQDMSFAARNAAGAAEGLSVDLLQAALSRLGVRPAGWVFLRAAEVRQAVQEGRVDLLLGADEDADRTPLLRFIGPFIEYPTVIIGTASSGAFDLDQLGGRRLALTPNNPARPLVDSRHPGIVVVDCADLDRCIDAVAAGEADATLADVVSAALALARKPRPQVQMIGSEPRLRRFHSLAVADRHAPLVPLLKRALDVAQQVDLPDLKARWFSRPTRQDVLQALAWRYGPWAAGALLLLAALWLWHSRQLHAEVRRTRIAQAEAERSAAATRRFTAFLAHEVRNSLHAVIAGTELARLPGPARGDVSAMLAESARSTLHLLNNLIDRERLDTHGLALRPAPAQLGPLVLAVVDELRPAATVRGQALRAHLPDPDPLLLLDALRVQQVLRNLLANAIKYGDGGAIDVQARVLPGAGVAPCRVELDVLDRGPGMVSVPKPEGGYGPTAGLGLPLCHDLARLMGGSLVLSAREGGGTQARLHFAAAAAPRPAGPDAALQVLVVEDADVYALLLASALEQRGHAVRAAASLAAARAELAARPPDLLLCDVNLPDGDASGLIAEAEHLAGTRVRIVLMTADLESTPPDLPTQATLLQKTDDVRAFVDAVLQAAQRPLAAPA